MQQSSLRAHQRARFSLLPLLLASTAMTAAPALAQDALEQPGAETVIVTAQKREENLQKAAIAVQALTATKIEELHITDFKDYAKYFSSLSYTTGGQGGTGAPGFYNVSMRAVVSGNDGNHSASLPTVGTYLDEQPITTINGALDIHMYDIARVEALAGPQGTLYGASSLSGTVRIITNRPDPSEFEAGYNLEGNVVDHGGLGGVAEGFVNIPLADNVAVRLVGWAEHDAGYIDNVRGTRTYPTSGITIDNFNRADNDYNDANIYGGRAALRIDLNDSWTITPTIMGQETRTNGSFAFDPQVRDLEVTHFYPEFTHDRWYQAALTIQGKISNLDLVYSGGYMGRWIDSASDYTDYSYWYDVLYGYGAYIIDSDGNIVDPSQYIKGEDYFTKQSHELRISSPKEDRLRFIAGLFYERQFHYIVQDYKVNAIGTYPGNDPDTSIAIAGWPSTLWLTHQDRYDTDYAAFGEISFDIMDNLTVTGGIRFFKAENSLKGFFGFNQNYSSRTGINACTPVPTVEELLAVKKYHRPCINLDKSVEEDGETHRVNLSWQITDDHLVYATYSTGFRPGGVNRRGTVPPYSSDTLTNYEIGWKTSWNDDTLRFNGAIYWEDWKKFQFSFLGLNSFTEIHNAGDAVVKGVEIEFLWLPTADLTISGAGAYNDAKTTDDFCGPVVDGKIVTVCPGPLDPDPPQAPAGTQLPTAPKWKGSITARHDFRLWGMNAHFQASGAYESSKWADLRLKAPNPVTGEIQAVRGFLGRMPGYGTVDFSTGVEEDNWTLEFYLKNAFDERGQTYRFAECQTLVCGNQPYIVVTRPRTFGIRFGQRF
ncbi:MAG: TonB-dependent receptor [Alphaproteobacteria bacterium]